MLIRSRKVEQRIMIGDNVSVVIVEIRGDQVRLGVEAPQTVKVYRKEVFDAIRGENEAAAASASRFQDLSFPWKP